MLTVATITFGLTTGTFLVAVIPIIFLEKRRLYNTIVAYRLTAIMLRYGNG